MSSESSMLLNGLRTKESKSDIEDGVPERMNDISCSSSSSMGERNELAEGEAGKETNSAPEFGDPSAEYAVLNERIDVCELVNEIGTARVSLSQR